MFSTRSENEEDFTVFAVTPRIMALLVGEPFTAGFSIELLDISTIPLNREFPSKWRNRGLALPE